MEQLTERDKALALGMQVGEYERMVKVLGRQPTDTEIAVFSVEWAEHCGYPRSRTMLDLLPKTGRFKTYVGADCGGFEIKPGWWILFKMESHNHPSQVGPFQGALTGILGILRDPLCKGGRPVAFIDPLRFGAANNSKCMDIMAGVIQGIAGAGNCIGVPTIGGELFFHPSYNGNCLVGVMCIAIASEDQLQKNNPQPGDLVVYLGNKTGGDGIGGCSVLASAEFGEGEQKRPTVQVGDPFGAKCLIEAALETIHKGLFTSKKDMGAAGLTCTTCEQSAAAKVGMDIDLDLVPVRETGLTPAELMMSESQERMLGCAKPENVPKIQEIYGRWGLEAVVLGKVVTEDVLRIRSDGQVVAEMPASALADPPVYDLPTERPAYLDEAQSWCPSALADSKDPTADLKQLLLSPNIASTRWVWEQYDHMVGTSTVLGPGQGDAAVLRLREVAPMGIAATADCNSRYCYLDPFKGGVQAVCEAARNLACVGARPAAITDCLCFGNPDKPDRFWTFKEAVKGIAQASRRLDIAVVSGNVSFYNESPDSCVLPTPFIGMVGALNDVSKRVAARLKDQGDLVVLLSAYPSHRPREMGGTEYLSVIHEKELGRPPHVDPVYESRLIECLLELADQELLSSAHDVSLGGLSVAIAESCMAGQIGAEITLPQELCDPRLDVTYFSEFQGGVVVSLIQEDLDVLNSIAAKHQIVPHLLGRTGGSEIQIYRSSSRSSSDSIVLPVAEAIELSESVIPTIMGERR